MSISLTYCRCRRKAPRWIIATWSWWNVLSLVPRPLAIKGMFIMYVLAMLYKYESAWKPRGAYTHGGRGSKTLWVTLQHSRGTHGEVTPAMTLKLVHPLTLNTTLSTTGLINSRSIIYAHVDQKSEKRFDVRSVHSRDGSFL